MNIKVQYQIDEGTPITCTFGDDCNHAGAEFCEDHVNWGSFEEPVFAGAMVCDKCNAYDPGEGWEY